MNSLRNCMIPVLPKRLGVATTTHTRAFSQSLVHALPSKLKPLTADEGSSIKYNYYNSDPDQQYSSRARPARRRPTSDRKPNGTKYQPRFEIEPPIRPRKRPAPTPHEYLARRETIKRRFPEGWAPPRTISREAMEVLRSLHAQDPVQFRTPVLASKFKISPEAVSRILKSKWRPSPERTAKLIARDNLAKDKANAARFRVERNAAAKSLEGCLDIIEQSRGKDKLNLK